MGVDLIRKYFPDLTDRQYQQFDQLQDVYTFWNEQINVISRKDIHELYLRHVLHSLAIARFISFKEGSSILDLGSGGGFPGIPLAIYFPEVNFVLCDSIGKKMKVAGEVANALELKNVTTYTGRVETVEGKFDFIISRAVAPLGKLIQWSSRSILKKSTNMVPNGWICLKGGDLVEEASLTRKDFQILPLQTWFTEDFFETKRIVYVKA